MIYRAVISGLDEDGVLRIDAALGDERAQAELDRQRLASVSAAEFEVG